MKQDVYTKSKKLFFDRTDGKDHLTLYRMLNNFVIRRGMVLNIVHDINSLRQNRWLERCIGFKTQERKDTTNDFEKDFFKLRDNAFYGKVMRNVRNRLKIIFWKTDDEEIIEQQSKLAFNGNDKSFTN